MSRTFHWVSLVISIIIRKCDFLTLTRNTCSESIRFTGTKTNLPEMLRMDQIFDYQGSLGRTCLFAAEAESTFGEDALEVDMEVLE